MDGKYGIKIVNIFGTDSEKLVTFFLHTRKKKRHNKKEISHFLIQSYRTSLSHTRYCVSEVMEPTIWLICFTTFCFSIYIIAHIAGNFSVYACIACLFVWPSNWPQLTSYYCIFRLESMIDRMRATNGMNFGMTFSMHTASSLVRPSGNASLAVDPIMIVRWLRGHCALEHRQSTELERRFRCSYLWGGRRKCVNKLVFVIFVCKRYEIAGIIDCKKN